MRDSAFKLAGVTVDPRLGEIGGERIDQNAMHVLLVLVEAAPELVSVAELLDEVWHGAVVGDNVVHQALTHLRKALGRNPKSVIETVARRGYRVVAQTEAIEAPFVSRTSLQLPPFTVLGKTDEQLQETADVVRADLRASLLQSFLIVTEQAAQYELAGEMRSRDDATAQVTFRLIRSSDGRVVWQRSLELARQLTEFAHAEFIATTVSHQTDLRGRAELQTKSETAIDFLMRGQAEFSELAQGIESADMLSAERHYRAAMKADPNFSHPVFALGIHYKNRKYGSATWADVVDEAHALVRRAMQTNPHSTFLLGTINAQLDLDYPAAIANFEYQRARGPETPGVIDSEIARVLLNRGDVAESISMGKSALRLGAGVNRRSAKLNLALAYALSGELERADRFLTDLTSPEVADDSIWPECYSHKIRLSHAIGATADATQLLERALSARGPRPFVGELALLGRESEAREALSILETRHQAKPLTDNGAAFWGAFYLGETDLSLVWLERLIENREWMHLPALRLDPDLHALRNEPRFQQAMARLREIEETGSPTRSVAYPG